MLQNWLTQHDLTQSSLFFTSGCFSHVLFKPPLGCIFEKYFGNNFGQSSLCNSASSCLLLLLSCTDGKNKTRIRIKAKDFFIMLNFNHGIFIVKFCDWSIIFNLFQSIFTILRLSHHRYDWYLYICHKFEVVQVSTLFSFFWLKFGLGFQKWNRCQISVKAIFKQFWPFKAFKGH